MTSLVPMLMVLMTGFVIVVPVAMALVAATGHIPRSLTEEAPAVAQSTSRPRT